MVNIEITASDLPELWEEYVEEKGFVPTFIDFLDESKITPIMVKSLLRTLTSWLFGGQEEDNE